MGQGCVRRCLRVTGIRNPQGDFDDCEELQNTFRDRVSRADSSLNDDPTQPRKWSFHANALVEGRGIELQATADLWDIEGDATHAGGEGLVLVAVGVAESALGALVGFRAQGGGAPANHGLLDEEADAIGEAVGTLFGERLHDGGQEVRVLWVDHG